jgi:hypothetical protein
MSAVHVLAPYTRRAVPGSTDYDELIVELPPGWSHWERVAKWRPRFSRQSNRTVATLPSPNLALLRVTFADDQSRNDYLAANPTVVSLDLDSDAKPDATEKTATRTKLSTAGLSLAAVDRILAATDTTSTKRQVLARLATELGSLSDA